MPELNHYAAIQQAIIDLLTRHSDLFVGMGRNLFTSFAIILICWFGIRAALSSSDQGGGFRLANFASLILTIAFGQAMITYYDRPLPAFGVSFKELIINQGIFLSNQIEIASVNELQLRLYEVIYTMEWPFLLDVLSIIRYVLVELALIFAQMAVLGVISFGYVALGVIVLVGPIFIPFFIVPRMEWLFWGWFRAFIQYSFYQVVAHAFVFVFGNLLIHFLDQHPPPFDGPRLAYLFVPFLFLLLSFTYGLLKVPSLVNGIFSGRSGESALPRQIS
jgi:hypothetical protein